jgi:hypothetical protein
MEQPGQQLQEGEIGINVDFKTAQILKCMEYDKVIAEAEATVSDLKKQKATYIFESNVQLITLQYKQQQEQAKSAS